MIEGNINSKSTHENTPNNKIEKNFIKEKDIIQDDTIKILIEHNNSFNDESTNYITTFNDIKDKHYNHNDSYSDNKGKIKTMRHYFEEQENIKKSIEIKNCPYKKKMLKIFLTRLFYATIIGIIGICIQCYFIILSDTYYKTGDEPLKDRMHEIFKEIPAFMNTPFVNGSIMFFLFITLLRFGLFCPLLLSITILIRIILMLSFIYCIRSFFIYVTTLPCPIPTCQPLKHKTFVENLYTFYLIITAQVYECTDLVISGHTAFTTLLTFFWFFYERNIYVKTTIFFYSIYIYIIIIISRFHYTVDVLMGYVFGGSVFLFYHYLIDVAARRYALNTSVYPQTYGFSGSFTDRFRVFQYFIRALTYLEALDHRMKFALSYDKEWNCFCTCVPVNKSSLLIKKKNVRNEEYYDFSEHFYHSYAGNGTYNLSTIRNIIKEFKRFFGMNKKN
ncbi:sphingomyelin synthase 1, putative [Plasmodium sp. gorilla clade G2]|uniref:sphingomyelin synthase 1, putative n=1 Tax=Plasmodium sp. gorilla clade G2 TaxID=880535 RepID=UPI000D21DB9E|nr:sphingomyelin synthase 1, putative [Plasmodium sp. gorilla clade G2]SOV12659.1 sphingomyelin synthase 1, putative [Plasmodium sp. gorilla clade G2]